LLRSKRPTTRNRLSPDIEKRVAIFRCRESVTLFELYLSCFNTHNMYARLYLLLLFILPCLGTLKGQTESEILQNIRAKRFNEANALLLTYQGEHKFLYEGLVQNAFNQKEKSIQTLLKLDQETLSDSLKFAYLRVMNDNYVKVQNYKEAYATGKLLTEKYNAYFEADDREAEADAVKIWKCLQHSPAQKVIKSGDSRLSFAKDLAGLHTLPVKFGKTTHNFVFDTGAGISCVTDTYAKKLKIKIVSREPINVQGGTGAANSVRIGLVPKLSFGNITVENAVFLVFPDSAFSFAGGAYTINGIIGFPIIEALDLIAMEEDSIYIPQTVPVNPKLHHNFAFIQMSPIIYLRVFDQELPCLFDTGDSDFSFTKTFYDQFSSQLNGEFQQLKKAGAGGAVEYKALVAKPFHIFAGGQDILPAHIVVDTENDHVVGNEIYGNIGQGLIKKFKRTTIDFVNSDILFE
jgi:hypothetical protein